MCSPFTIENYNPTCCTSPTAVLGHRIVCDWDDNGLFVIGGWRSGYVQDNFIRQVWKYNFSNKHWKQLRSVDAPISLANHTMCRLNENRLLIYGGSLLSRQLRGNNNETFLYDITNEKWHKINTTGDHCPQPSRHWFGQSLSRSGSDVYVATGRRHGATPGTSSLLIHRLNLHNLCWQYLSKPETEPQGRVRHEMVAYDRNLLIFGGAHCSFDTTFSLDIIPCFDMVSNTWSNLHTVPDPIHGYPDPRTCHTCIVHEDYVYVCGGYFIPSGNLDQMAGASKAFDDLWRFHLPTNRWTLLPLRLPKTLWSHAADVTSDGRMYIFGGCTKSADEKERTNNMFKIPLQMPTLEQLCWDELLSTNPNALCNTELSLSFLKKLQD